MSILDKIQCYLHRLDEKLRFADLSNELAHSNTVLLQTTMGAVAVTEQAIINEAHEQGFVVPDRRNDMKVIHRPLVPMWLILKKVYMTGLVLLILTRYIQVPLEH